ncbi:hypothetical protein CLAIMM_02469 isoform 2 [Cladophialophora immunda]|nr:hypothetical protein CLAIMM_02469 isoform 1 [Cladophialophora immunda]OQU96379.1 hypothetical protein CLAIMM_02469 isoform 2 [Cladophialophora immunda]
MPLAPMSFAPSISLSGAELLSFKTLHLHVIETCFEPTIGPLQARTHLPHKHQSPFGLAKEVPVKRFQMSTDSKPMRGAVGFGGPSRSFVSWSGCPINRTRSSP